MIIPAKNVLKALPKMSMNKYESERLLLKNAFSLITQLFPVSQQEEQVPSPHLKQQYVVWAGPEQSTRVHFKHLVVI